LKQRIAGFKNIDFNKNLALFPFIRFSKLEHIHIQQSSFLKSVDVWRIGKMSHDFRT